MLRMLIAAVALTVCASAYVQPARAMLPATPQLVRCPLTGELFEWSGGFSSYTSFGRSLDFEPMVMGMLRSSNPAIPSCKDSGMPIYRVFKEAEVTSLKELVKSSEWSDLRALGNDWLLAARVARFLQESDESIARDLLRAVWTATEANRLPILRNAIETWTGIAESEAPLDTILMANWLRIDLNRQAAHFDEAEKWLLDFRGRFRTGTVVTVEMIGLEETMIFNRDRKPAGVHPRD